MPSLRAPTWTLALPAALLVLLVYALPLAGVLHDAFTTRAGDFTLGNFTALLGSSSMQVILWRTLWFSAEVTLATLLLGYPLAYVLVKLRGGWQAALLLVVGIPFFTSVLIRSYAWIVILGNAGLVNNVLLALGLVDRPVRLAFTGLGALIAMVQVELPVMVLSLFSVMRRIDRSLLRAAQSAGATPATAFWTVFRPLAAPGVAAGCSLVFCATLGSFVTPAMLGGPGQYLLAQAIEVRVSELNEGNVAAAMAMLLLALVLGLMLLFRRPLGLTLAKPGPRRARQRLGWPALPLLHRLGGWLAEALSAARRPLLALASGVTLIYLALPILVVIPLAFSSAAFLRFPPPGWSLRWFHAYFADADWLGSTGFSLWVSALAAVLALALGTTAAFAIRRAPSRGMAAAHMVFVSPLIMPHMVISVALYLVLVKAGLLGSPLAFVAAYALFGLPYVVVVVAGALERLDPALERAAASLGAPPVVVWRSVLLPLLRPALASAFLFAFLAGFDDLVAALFLSTPGRVTLPMRMWDDIRMEISPRVAAVAVVFFAVAALGLVLARWRGRARPPAA